MTDLQIFSNPEFGKIRVVDVDGKPYFVAADVARALGYVKPENAVSRHCKGTLKRGIPTTGGKQQMNVIPKGDIYRLAAKSELPGAEKFESWIFDEVLVSIGEHGGYVANQDNLTSEQILANAVLVAKSVIAEKDKQILELAPKAEFFDAVADSETAIEMAAVAKVLAIPGYGRNNLFEFLRNRGVLQENNIPYQKHIDAGHFRIVEQRYNKPDGSTHISIKTLVYQKGVDYIRKLVASASAEWPKQTA